MYKVLETFKIYKDRLKSFVECLTKIKLTEKNIQVKLLHYLLNFYKLY